MGLGGRHQLTYEHACIAAVAGGRWRESARVWTENNSFFKSASATESIYREWECFSKGGKEAPPKGDSDSPIEDKFEREADLASSEAERTKSDEGLGDLRRNCLWDYSPKTHRELRRAGELEERLDRKGARASAYAEDPTTRGEFPPQARHWAIRVELLDSEREWAWIAQHRNGSRVHAGIDRKKHPVGLGRRHQLTYKHACIAAVVGGRWRESARVWTGNFCARKRAYATESIYREWDRFSKGERKLP